MANRQLTQESHSMVQEVFRALAEIELKTKPIPGEAANVEAKLHNIRTTVWRMGVSISQLSRDDVDFVDDDESQGDAAEEHEDDASAQGSMYELLGHDEPKPDHTHDRYKFRELVEGEVEVEVNKAGKKDSKLYICLAEGCGKVKDAFGLRRHWGYKHITTCTLCGAETGAMRNIARGVQLTGILQD
ncbi:hypothetical protein F4810DRAFT_708715 [Camillea tinctor]|nr:hypothetical protein F4810DRAFT_708715 [Camillea tinctor]